MNKKAKIAIVGGAAVLTITGLILLFRSKFKQADYQDDAKLPEKEAKGNDALVITNMTDQEVVDMVTSIDQSFNSAIDEIVNTVPTINPTGYMRLLATNCQSKEELKACLELAAATNEYKDWVSRAMDAGQAAAFKASDVLLNFSTAEKQTKCAQTTFVDNVTVDCVAETVVENKSRRAFLSAVRTNTSVKTTTERTTESHVMVPHCTNYVVDTAALKASEDAVLAAVKMAFVSYGIALQSEPDANDFIAVVRAS